MQSKWLLVLSFLILLSWTITAEQFYVVPSSKTSCPREPCYTLIDVVKHSSIFFVSNAVIIFLPGHHKTTYRTERHNQVLIENVTNISMVGYHHTNGDSVIDCGGYFGFMFINVTMLKIAKLHFSFCEAYFISNFPVEKNYIYPHGFKKIPSTNISRVTLYFLQTVNVTISEVSISHSNGNGLLGINMLGLSTISQTVFSGNKPNCMLIFLDIPSALEKIPLTELTIEDSHVKFGEILHGLKGKQWGATGLSIMLAQVTYNVHIYINNITTFCNRKVENWNGNFQFIIENWEHHCSVIQARQITSTNTAEEEDTAQIHLKSNPSGHILHTINCSIPAEMVHISDSYFVGVGIFVDAKTKDCDSEIVLRNITVQNSSIHAMRISRMKSIKLQDVKFACNSQNGILIYNSNVTVSGKCFFMNNTGHTGILYLYKSAMSFTEYVIFIRNQVEWAIVIVAKKSTFKFHQTAELVENKGKVGGTIALYDSSQLIFGNQSNVSFIRNRAEQNGGAILAKGSSLFVESEARITFTDNKAYHGGALSFQGDARITINSQSQIVFTKNHAQHYGGALYVEEPSPKITFHLRRYIIGCFFQLPSQSSPTNTSLTFANNTARSAGDILYGGWVDFCNCAGKPGVDVFDALFHFQKLSSQLSAVSSNPTRVCLCTDGYPDCHITQYNVTAYPGETFQIPVVAVGQSFGTVPALIHAWFTSVNPDSRPEMKPPQRTQHVGGVCNNLKYTIASSNQNEMMLLTVSKLYKLSSEYINQNPDNSETLLLLKDLQINVQLNPCRLGFVLHNSSCTCLPQIQQHGINYSVDTQKIYRPSSTWINAIITNGSQEGILVHEHCPFDYCKPESFDLDLEDPDEQCAFHRSGILCGACQQNLSHVFGTSACRECSSMWALLWLPVIALAGLALVVLLLVLNLTVSVGTINGLIFYANIVRANHATFFPPNTTNSFLSWFIAWINLDFGIETCFYNGLDAYVKTWLQFVFPLYIWFLVITIIVMSHYSKRATRLSGRNAVQVLTTLFLLSYAKLLRIIITIFQSTELVYPDKSVRNVWFYDGNVDYLKGIHIPLFVAALLLLFITLPYTVILIFIQLLQQFSSYRVLFWVQKMKPLFDTYTGPFKDRHCYWTGLLLLVRIVLFLIFSLNTRGDSNINLLGIIIAVLTLLVYMVLAGGVYKKWSLNVIEYSFFFNLGIFTFATSYTKITGHGQVPVAYTSSSIAFTLFIIIVAVHVITKFTSSQHCNWISIKIIANLRVQLFKLSSSLSKFCCKQGSSHHNDQLGISHASVELRESLLEYCS